MEQFLWGYSMTNSVILQAKCITRKYISSKERNNNCITNNEL